MHKKCKNTKLCFFRDLCTGPFLGQRRVITERLASDQRISCNKTTNKLYQQDNKTQKLEASHTVFSSSSEVGRVVWPLYTHHSDNEETLEEDSGG